MKHCIRRHLCWQATFESTFPKEASTRHRNGNLSYDVVLPVDATSPHIYISRADLVTSCTTAWFVAIASVTKSHTHIACRWGGDASTRVSVRLGPPLQWGVRGSSTVPLSVRNVHMHEHAIEACSYTLWECKMFWAHHMSFDVLYHQSVLFANLPNSHFINPHHWQPTTLWPDLAIIIMNGFSVQWNLSIKNTLTEVTTL